MLSGCSYFFTSFFSGGGGGGGILKLCKKKPIRQTSRGSTTYLGMGLGVARTDLLPWRRGVRKVTAQTSSINGP